MNEDLMNKNVDEVTKMADGWLNDIELVRLKSRNLNDRLSGCLKDRISCLYTVLRSFIDRINNGDMSYLKDAMTNLLFQLREANKEETRLKDFSKEADDKIDKLSAELRELRNKMRFKSLSIESDTAAKDKIKSGTPFLVKSCMPSLPS